MSIQIYPSLLAADFTNLEREINEVKNAGIDTLHIDIMDGVFVNNIAIGFPIIDSIVEKIPGIKLDCHFMTIDPKKWIEILINNNNLKCINSISFHVETVNYEKCCELINKIKSNSVKCGLALKPKTDISEIFNYTNLVDFILIMTVEPGFGGQKFIPSCLEKIKILRKFNSNINIQVDGGINLDNCKNVIDAGANMIVSGSTIFNSTDKLTIVNKLKYFE